MTKKDEKGKNRSRPFTTSTGIEVVVNSVPIFLIDQATRVVELPDPPTYTVTTGAGEEETHPHDETTLVTDEDRAAWDEYKETVDRLTLEQNERMMRVLMTKGISVDMEAENVKEWEEEMEYIGIPLPKSKVARRARYVETNVFGSVPDLVDIMQIIMELSGVSEEAVATAVASFQGAIQGLPNNALTPEKG